MYVCTCTCMGDKQTDGRCNSKMPAFPAFEHPSGEGSIKLCGHSGRLVIAFFVQQGSLLGRIECSLEFPAQGRRFFF